MRQGERREAGEPAVLETPDSGSQTGVTLSVVTTLCAWEKFEAAQKQIKKAAREIRESLTEAEGSRYVGSSSEIVRPSALQSSHAFKEVHGTTFREFVIIHRIRRAEQMLCCANVSITDVAFSVGFNDLSHFAQMFRRHVGVRPSDYVQGQKRKVAEMDIPRNWAHAKLS